MSETLDQDLRILWQDHSDTTEVPSIEEIETHEAQGLAAQHRRNGNEYIAAIIVLALFGGLAIVFPSLWCRIGIGLICGATVWVMAFIAWRGTPKSRSLDETCRAFQIREIQREHALLRWAWLWYLAPFVPGLLAFLIGIALTLPPHSRPFVAIVGLFIAATFGRIARANLRGAKALAQDLNDLLQL